jgi:hypothetical protein
VPGRRARHGTARIAGTVEPGATVHTDHVAGGPPAVLGRRIAITARRAGGERFPVELTITRIELDGAPTFVAHMRVMPLRVRARIRSASNSATIACTLKQQPADRIRRVVHRPAEVELDLVDGELVGDRARRAATASRSSFA